MKKVLLKFVLIVVLLGISQASSLAADGNNKPDEGKQAVERRQLPPRLETILQPETSEINDQLEPTEPVGQTVSQEPITIDRRIIKNEILTFKATVSGGGFKGLLAKGMGMSANIEIKIESYKNGKLKITMGSGAAHKQGEKELEFEEEVKTGFTDETMNIATSSLREEDRVGRSGKKKAKDEGESKTTIINPEDLSFYVTAYTRVGKKKREKFYNAVLKIVKDDFSGIDVREITEKDYIQDQTSKTELMGDYPVYDLNALLYLARYVKKFESPKTVYFFEKGIIRPVKIQFGRKTKMDYQGQSFYTEEFIVTTSDKRDIFRFFIGDDINRLPIKVEFAQSATLELINRTVK